MIAFKISICQKTYRIDAVLKVLIIDDEPSVARSMQLFLQDLYEVELCPLAQAALEKSAAGARYAAILCDVHLPDLDGPEFYFRLQAVDAGQAERLLFVSGGGYRRELGERLDATRRPILSKPFFVDAIRRAVAAIAEAS